MIRRILGIVLVLCLFWLLPVTARGAEADVEMYAQSMIQYYRYYQEDGMDAIRDLAELMADIEPEKAAMWENIMEDWSWVRSRMPVGVDVLPDGLPEDDSLCIVVLGYQLSESGTMQEELMDRLVVALSSAIKYPNALICVSGGQTSEVKGATEAGLMASWLKKKGIDESRIIVENQSLSTTANAVNVYKTLNASYPQVSSVAMITSDYHLNWGGSMFTTVSDYKHAMSGGRQIELVAGAVCNTGATMDTLLTEAWGICTIAGIEFDENATAPAYYESVEPEETEAVAEETRIQRTPLWVPKSQTAQEETEETGNNFVVPIVILAVLAVGIYVLTPKKPKKKRKKPEFKWD